MDIYMDEVRGTLVLKIICTWKWLMQIGSISITEALCYQEKKCGG